MSINGNMVGFVPQDYVNYDIELGDVIVDGVTVAANSSYTFSTEPNIVVDDLYYMSIEDEDGKTNIITHAYSEESYQIVAYGNIFCRNDMLSNWNSAQCTVTVYHVSSYKPKKNYYINNIEGVNCFANDLGSHVEGIETQADSQGSHAEGGKTNASGIYAHAEGYRTETHYSYAHAEGMGTVANGSASHAEGSNTIASGNYSHAQGKYNVEDTEKVYAHIVGNGTTTARSNAHTLDWTGTAWFSGDVYVGSTSGTNKDDGSEKLVKTSELSVKQDKITGTAGQFVVIGDDGEVTTITVSNAEGVSF